MAKIVEIIEIDVPYCDLEYGRSLRRNDSFTKVMLDFDGVADASTTFTDSNAGGSAHTWTANGNVQIDTSSKAHGTGAALFDGTGDYLTTPDHADFTLGSSNFTVDCWFNCTAAGGVIRRIAGQNDNAATASTRSFVLFRLDSNVISFRVCQGSTTTSVNGTTQFTDVLNAGWHHVTAVRVGDVLKLFIDGVQEGGDVAFTGAVNDSSNLMGVGTTGEQTTDTWSGSIDEFRLDVGRAGVCPAVLGVDSAIKCFNTLKTCAVPASYSNAPVTWIFARKDVDYVPDFVGDHMSNLLNVSHNSATISIGDDLGQRATLTFTLEDHKHPDTGPGFDKYVDDRPYDPYEQGTIWGKFRARQYQLRGAAVRWRIGNDEMTSLDQFETRHYVVDSINGPSTRGVFQIIAKDVLKQLDSERAKAPYLSDGFLSSDITDTATELTVLPVGIGDSYPNTGKVAVGAKEIVRYSRDIFTKALYHFEGTDGATTTSDTDTLNPHAVTFVGNAQIDTARSKFGASSLLLDGTGDYISLDGHADFAFGSGDFTVEMWVWFTTIATGDHLYDSRASGTNGFYPTIFISSTDKLTFYTNSANRITGTTAIATGQWHHIALARSGTSTKLFLNGVQEGSTYSDSNVYLNGSSGRPFIGVNSFNVAGDISASVDEVRISKGIARYTANFTPSAVALAPVYSGDVFGIVRAQENTEASSHSSQSRVQEVLEYSGETVAFIIHDLLVNYADIDPSYIDLPTWEDEVDQYLGNVYSAIIAEPTAVKDLINELIQQASLILWWDDLAGQIRLNVVHGVVPSNETLDDDNTIKDSLDFRDQPEKRRSQIWVWYGLINPLEGDSDNNYRSAVLSIDTESEANYGSPAIETIKSRWIAPGGRTIAQRLGEIRLGRFKNPPRLVSFSVARYSVDDDVRLGQAYQASSYVNQDATGEQIPLTLHVTSVSPSGEQIAAEAEELLWTAPDTDLVNRPIIFDADINDVNLRTSHDLLYPTPESGDTVTVTVSAGAIIGSTSTSSPAMTTGSWPAGVTILLTVNGRIQGKGGNGGTYPGGFANGQAGGVGGPALEALYAIDLTDTDGEIFGGGGGGGAGGLFIPGGGGAFPGGGGGGGAGQVPGSGGSGSTGLSGTSSPGNPGTTEAGGTDVSAPNCPTGGDGGGPGLAGSAGQTVNTSGGAGGAAGKAIVGIANVTTIGVAGDRRGGTV